MHMTMYICMYVCAYIRMYIFNLPEIIPVENTGTYIHTGFIPIHVHASYISVYCKMFVRIWKAAG